MPKLTCRRCRALAHFEVQHDGNEAIRCRHCGELEWIKRETPEGMVIKHVHKEEGESQDLTPRRLPGRGSRLHQCLTCLADYGPLTSSEVADRLGLDKSKVAISFSVLTTRGFTEALERNKGKKGGSLWGLTRATKHMLGDR